MNPIETLVSKVLDDINEKMTDVVFLVIQNDQTFRRWYQDLIDAHGVDTVNQQIGKAVKEQLKHKTDKGRNDNPRSTLIQSHQIHTS